jgi:Cu(I)/Ag(I) efflux system membrane protein CusA/SilA
MSVIYQATTEIRAAVVTSIATTIVSFLPVFAMQAQEGKLFHPLAFTKTFALLSAFILGIVVLPTLVHIFFNISFDRKKIKKIWNGFLIVAGFVLAIFWKMWPALAITAVGINNLLDYRWSEKRKEFPNYINIAITVLFATWYLSIEWLPLGAHNSEIVNFLFVAGIITVVLLLLMTMVHFYENILRWALMNKWKFLIIPALTIISGLLIWHATGKEFMPSLNEGSFLLMPSSMPHSSIEKNLEYIETLDKRLSTIPEVEVAVGKWGRVNSALDPAPIQMFENTINYRSEYILDENGHRMQFKVDRNGNYILKNNKKFNPGKEAFRIIPSDSLIPDKNGEYFRQWRLQIKKPLDIWKEIVKVTDIPGLTSAPKLQPIETRLIMLSTGMRAPMGLKVFGPDLNSIEQAGMLFEKALKEVPSIKASAVFYDRAVGAPYLEIRLNREAMARYGMSVNEVQELLQVAIGGMTLSTSVEGRERFPLRVRYARELRDNPDDIKRILVPAMNGIQIPLGEVADIEYARGAQMIRSENTFLIGFVIFDKIEGKAEVDVVKEASKIIKGKIDSGVIKLPPGITYKFAGNYENQLRATKRLAIVVPISLIMIFLLLFFQFRTITASFIHFSGVFVAFSGGFIMLWLYGEDWFMNFSVAGLNLRDMFQMHTINLSVAVWVGFIALFGIATNDGVIMGTYIHQVFEDLKPKTIHDVREAVVMAGKKRVRPAMMTTAVAVIALLPVLSSTGKGSDIMVPMAIPMFGGMVIQVMTIFVVPLFQAMWREGDVIHKNKIAPQTLNNQLENENDNI